MSTILSTILFTIKIIINGIGFILSYLSMDMGNKYMPGILLGLILMMISLMIPEDIKNK